MARFKTKNLTETQRKVLAASGVNITGVKMYRSGWATVGSQRCYFRSGWEWKFACYLEMLRRVGVIQSWDHEAETFWFNGIKRGVVSYLPDFRVKRTGGAVFEYYEVKGYMDSKSATKIKRFRKYYPDKKLVVIDLEWFKGHPEVRELIPPF